MAVMAFMENETLKISVMKELERGRFFCYDWATSKTMPDFMQDRMEDLIHRFGVPLLEHCFLEWRKENLVVVIEL